MMPCIKLICFLLWLLCGERFSELLMDTNGRVVVEGVYDKMIVSMMLATRPSTRWISQCKIGGQLRFVVVLHDMRAAHRVCLFLEKLPGNFNRMWLTYSVE